MFYKNVLTCVDRKHGWKAAIFFDYGEKKGIFTSQKTVPKDLIEGIIYVPTKQNFEVFGKLENPPRCIQDLTEVKTEIARISGSWMDKIEINGVTYWHHDKVKPVKIKLPPNPLPSDSRYREDLIWLRKNNTDYADSWKDGLEIRQREDQKCREKYKK